MTQEEKAKAYDEALRKVRKIYNKILNNEILGFPDQLREMFPELKESEDERIRQGIVETIKQCADILDPKNQKRMLDWLEKQKEQKPVHTAKEMWKEMRLEVYAQASGNRHEPNYSDDSTKMFSLCDIDEIFEKIGNSTVESQPVEWSEEDEKMYARVVRRYTDYKGVIMRTKEDSVAAKMLDAMVQEEIWLKSLHPQPHWKPSEKQLKALKMVANAVSLEGLNSLFEDLKKL